MSNPYYVSDPNSPHYSNRFDPMSDEFSDDDFVEYLVENYSDVKPTFTSHNDFLNQRRELYIKFIKEECGGSRFGNVHCNCRHK